MNTELIRKALETAHKRLDLRRRDMEFQRSCEVAIVETPVSEIYEPPDAEAQSLIVAALNEINGVQIAPLPFEAAS